MWAGGAGETSQERDDDGYPKETDWQKVAVIGPTVGKASWRRGLGRASRNGGWAGQWRGVARDSPGDPTGVGTGS